LDHMVDFLNSVDTWDSALSACEKITEETYSLIICTS